MQTVHRDYTKYGFSVNQTALRVVKGKISPDLVVEMSKIKEEPEWVLDFRLKSLEIFNKMPTPEWGADLSEIDYEQLVYYSKPQKTRAEEWDELPEKVKETFDRLGIPEAEKKYFSGVEVQFDSDVVLAKAKKIIEDQGVIFMDTDSAIKKHPEIVKKYFSKLIPPSDNKFAALNSVFFSGGSFVFVPKGVKVSMPLQAYFRINTEKFGQFERTLIIAEEGAEVEYIEGCTAPNFSSQSLHAAVVEVFCEKNSRVQYTTIQNWADNIYNLVTKRALVQKSAKMEWIDGNIGSKVTMKYPSCVLAGDNAHGEIISLAMAGENQTQHTGTKMIHIGKNTTSRVVSKSIVKDGGNTTYLGKIDIKPTAQNAQSNINCDGIIADSKSKAYTYPVNVCSNSTSKIQHEASVSKIDQEKIFYLTARGIPEDIAISMIVRGFIDPVIKKLPLEFALELVKLIDMEMEGSVG